MIHNGDEILDTKENQRIWIQKIPAWMVLHHMMSTLYINFFGGNNGDLTKSVSKKYAKIGYSKKKSIQTVVVF